MKLCTFNLWNADMTLVAPLKRPFPCGGRYQDQLFELTIPLDVQGCESPADGCVLQMYGNSVETRTYAICVDVVFTDGPVPAGTVLML